MVRQPRETLSSRGMQRKWKRSNKDPPRCLTHILYVESLKQLGMVSLVKRKPQGDLITAYNYTKGSYLDTTAKLLLVVPDRITRKTTTNSSFRGYSWTVRKIFSLAALE